MICPRCSVVTPGGSLTCFSCAGTKVGLGRKAHRVSKGIFEGLFGPVD